MDKTEQNLEEALKAVEEQEDTLNEESFLKEEKAEEKTGLQKKSVKVLSKTGGPTFQAMLQQLPLDPVLTQLPKSEVDLIPKQLLCRVCPNATWVKFQVGDDMNLACICRSGGGMDKQVTFDLSAPKEATIMSVVACGDLVRWFLNQKAE